MSEVKKFKNKEVALEALFEVVPISEWQQRQNLILAISYQGVWFAHQLSQALQSPFDLFLTTTIPAPLNPECIIGMVSETHDLITHDALVTSFGISRDYIYGEAKRRYEEHILSAVYQFRKGEMIRALKNEHIIIVDEGVNSGMLMMVAIKSCINASAQSISVVAPVMPYDVELLLHDIVDDVYTVLRPHHFMEIESYYEQYAILSTGDVENLLGNVIEQIKK